MVQESNKPAKTERLACLYLTFLNSKRGLSFKEIKTFFPSAYEGDEESARRKFERDKKDLALLGLELTHFEPGSRLPDGVEAQDHIYFARAKPAFLPEINFSADEKKELAAILFSAWTYATASEKELLRSLSMKLFARSPDYFSGEPEGRNDYLPLNAPPGEVLELQKALAAGLILEFEYSGRDRRVAGRTLVFHRGRWLLHGLCLEAREKRSFYLDRMQKLAISREKHRLTFSGPPEINLHPLALEVHDPLEIRFALEEDTEDQLYDFLDDYPLRESGESRKSGEPLKLYSITTRNRAAFLRWMLRNPEVVRQLDCNTRIAYIDFLAEIKANYAEGREIRHA